MELFQLRYFLAVAQFEHVTKAAESLHVAQPAVSQAIRHLEEELDVTLFDRENHHISLNSSGKLLQSKLLPIMSSLDRLPEEIKEASLKQPVIHMNLRSASAIITNCIIAYRNILSIRKSNLSFPRNRMILLLIISFLLFGVIQSFCHHNTFCFRKISIWQSLQIPAWPPSPPLSLKKPPRNPMSAWKATGLCVPFAIYSASPFILLRILYMKVTIPKPYGI